MKHVSGPNHVRHFHVGQLAHVEGWNMQACEAHESRTLFGTISTSRSAECRERARSGFCLVTLFRYRALGPFLRSNAPAFQFRSLAKLHRSGGPDRVDFTSFALTIQPLTPCNDINMPHTPPDHTTWALSRKPPSSPHFRCDAMVPSKRCSGSLAISSPACLSQYHSRGIYS